MIQTPCNLIQLSCSNHFFFPRKQVFLNENLLYVTISLEASNTYEMVTILRKRVTKLSSATFTAEATAQLWSP